MRKNRKRFNKYKKGFSLVEVVVVSTLIAILFGAVSYAVMFFYRTNSYAIEQAIAVNSARKGVESFIEDVRESGYSDEGSYPLISAGTSTLSFYSDVAGNSNVDKIRYFLDDGYFKKGITMSTGTPLSYASQPELEYIIAEDVRNEALATDIFSYYDNTGTQVVDTVNDLLDVTFIKMTLTININPARLPNDYTLYSSATLRNIVNAI